MGLSKNEGRVGDKNRGKRINIQQDNNKNVTRRVETIAQPTDIGVCKNQTKGKGKKEMNQRRGKDGNIIGR